MIYHNLQDFGRKPEDYDRIITGDLGKVGQRALLSKTSFNEGQDVPGIAHGVVIEHIDS